MPSWLIAGAALGATWALALYAYLAGYGRGYADRMHGEEPALAEGPCRIPGCPCASVVEAVRPWREAVVEDLRMASEVYAIQVLPEDDPTVAHVGPHQGREDF